MKKFIVLLVGILLFLMYATQRVFAEGIPFSVIPEFPDNHDSSIKSYYSLDMVGKEKQELHLKIKNNTEEKLSIKIDAVNGLTAKNGGIEYTTKEMNQYVSFTDGTYKLNELIDVQKTVILEPFEQKSVTIEVNSPKNPKGTYLGGLRFTPDVYTKQQIEKSENKVSFQINTKHAFAMAIQLNYEKDNDYAFEFGDNLIEFTPSGIIFLINMINDCACINHVETIKYEVYNEKEKLVLNDSVDVVKMAPKNKISYPIFWNGQVLNHGDYTVKITAFVNGKEIKKTNTFTVDKKEINKYVGKLNKDNSPILIDKSIPWWIWVLLIVGPVITFYFGFKKHKKNEEE